MVKSTIIGILAFLFFMNPLTANAQAIKRMPSSVMCSSADEFVKTVVRGADIKILSHKKIRNDEYLVVFVGPENARFVVARYNMKKNQVCVKEIEDGMNFDWKNIPGDLLKFSGIPTYPA